MSGPPSLPPPRSPTSPWWTVVHAGNAARPCTLAADGRCVTSGEGSYYNRMSCNFRANNDLYATALGTFDLEAGHSSVSVIRHCPFDAVQFGHDWRIDRYCGVDGPANVFMHTGDEFTFRSDRSNNRRYAGFTICATGTPVLLPSPPPPSPPLPLSPPPWPPAPPEPPSPSPLPAPPLRLCFNSCPFWRDFECDDGGEGSSYASCAACTDCTDCGSRPEGDCGVLPPIRSPPPPSPSPPPPRAGSWCGPSRCGFHPPPPDPSPPPPQALWPQPTPDAPPPPPDPPSTPLAPPPPPDPPSTPLAYWTVVSGPCSEVPSKPSCVTDSAGLSGSRHEVSTARVNAAAYVTAEGPFRVGADGACTFDYVRLDGSDERYCGARGPSNVRVLPGATLHYTSTQVSAGMHAFVICASREPAVLSPPPPPPPLPPAPLCAPGFEEVPGLGPKCLWTAAASATATECAEQCAAAGGTRLCVASAAEQRLLASLITAFAPSGSCGSVDQWSKCVWLALQWSTARESWGGCESPYQDSHPYQDWIAGGEGSASDGCAVLGRMRGWYPFQLKFERTSCHTRSACVCEYVPQPYSPSHPPPAPPVHGLVRVRRRRRLRRWWCGCRVLLVCALLRLRRLRREARWLRGHYPCGTPLTSLLCASRPRAQLEARDTPRAWGLRFGYSSLPQRH